MATRPVYFLDSSNNLKQRDIEFTWHSGFAISQKQKSIIDFHKKIEKTFECNQDDILEISSKSLKNIGIRLSAFNLQLKINDYVSSVEVFFQSSKVFEYGGPYKDLLNKPSILAKKDMRLKESGKLISFSLLEEEWSTEPKTFFYDWLYINAVYNNIELHNGILKYKYFTDIEFNPKKSINCQAKSAAFYLSLHNKGILDRVINDKNEYIRLFKNEKFSQETLF